jgi:hypothetical protein
MMAEKKEEFVISDRRRFAPEGELRSDVVTPEEEKAAAPVAPAAESKPAPPPEQGTNAELPEELPPPPSAHEQQQQTDAYNASGRKMDELFTHAAGKERVSTEMTFERLIESFYMTALLQLGALRQEGEPPGVDVMGARQTIDSLNLLQEKTKGNLTEREQNLLQTILFELRMAWIEITNAIAKGATSGPGPGVRGPVTGIKK